jgi:hypothetical protein
MSSQQAHPETKPTTSDVNTSSTNCRFISLEDRVRLIEKQLLEEKTKREGEDLLFLPFLFLMTCGGLVSIAVYTHKPPTYF